MRNLSPFPATLQSSLPAKILIVPAGFILLLGLVFGQPGEAPKAKELPGLEGYQIVGLDAIGGIALEDMHFDSIIARDVLLNGWLPYVGVTETFVIACKFPDCGSKRILFQVSRSPFSANRQHRMLTYTPPRDDRTVLRPIFDTTATFADQILGFKTYAADAALDHLFLGKKRERGPPDAPLLLEASASFFGKHHSNSCVTAGYTLVPNQRLDFRKTEAVEAKKLPGLKDHEFIGLEPIEGFDLAEIQFEKIIIHEVALYGRPPFSLVGRGPFSPLITETFLIACTFPQGGSKRILLQVCRLPYAENPAHRQLAITLPLKESPDLSRMFDADLKYTDQASGFQNYAAQMELTWPFLGQKNPNNVPLLLNASEAFYGKHHRDQCAKAGYTLVPAERLNLSSLPRSKKPRVKK